MKLKVTLVVKYFVPMKRHSGILNFILNLSESLGKLVDLTIITWRYEDTFQKEEQKDGYRIIRVKNPFLLTSALAARKSKPAVIIFGTGIFKLAYLLPYFIVFRFFTVGTPVIIGQYSAMDNKFSFLGYFLKPFVNHVIASSPDIDQFYRKTLKEKVTYIPPGINIQKLQKIKRAKSEGLNPVVGFFGHLNFNKGSDILFDAFKSLRPKKGSLILAGEGKLSKAYKKNSVMDKNIFIYGYLPDVRTYIKTCDILVFPYRIQNSILGLSLSAIEAMAMGKPLLVSKNSCLLPLVQNGRNGYVFKNRDELEKNLKELMADAKLTKKMGEKSFKMAQKYDISKIALQYEKLIMDTHETK
jgi:glycosyltransferase involved in cell wall biosynthesis